MSLPINVPSASALAFADALGRELRGDAPKKFEKTPEDKQRDKRRAEKTARRRNRGRV